MIPNEIIVLSVDAEKIIFHNSLIIGGGDKHTDIHTMLLFMRAFLNFSENLK